MCNGAGRFWSRTIAAILVVIGFAPAAYAQLPGVPLPNLPRVDVPVVTDTVNGAVGQVRNELGAVERLADLRQLRIRDLLRTRRQFVDRDPSGAPILRAEIVAFSPTDAALESARAAGFTISRERNLEGLDARVVVLHAPDRMSIRRALSRLRSLDPNGAYDYNHIYLDSGEIAADSSQAAEQTYLLRGESASSRAVAADAGEERRQKRRSAAANSRLVFLQPAQSASSLPVEAPSSSSSPQIRLGLVDGGIDAAHPVFSNAQIHTHGCNEKPTPSAHGTAVASLMIGRTNLFHGAVPGAELFAADVYCGQGTGGAVDAVVDAIAWIARQRVPVINVSLVGPKNTTLENVVRVVTSRGHLIVAAVGNDGAAAKPLYPASYPGVVGVTGVDSKQKVLLEACRGPQVDFAAPGADMAAALLSPTFAAVRGTSFAAPIVAGLLAAELPEPNAAAAEKAVSQLVQRAQDLGEKGMDKVYGNGLVGNAVRTAPALALVGPAPGSQPN